MLKIIIKNSNCEQLEKSEKLIGQKGWEHQLYIKNNYINITMGHHKHNEKTMIFMFPFPVYFFLNTKNQ